MLTTFAKIRILLAVLCASLLLTAIVIRNSYTPQKGLVKSARELESNLHKREKVVADMFSDKQFDHLATLPNNNTQ